MPNTIQTNMQGGYVVSSHLGLSSHHGLSSIHGLSSHLKSNQKPAKKNTKQNFGLNFKKFIKQIVKPCSFRVMTSSRTKFSNLHLSREN